MTPDAKTTYLDSAVLDTGDLLSSTPGGHHGARHLLVAGQGHQVQAPICAPCRYVGIAVVHSKAGDVALQGEALPDLALGDVVHVQAGARGDHQVLLRGPEQKWINNIQHGLVFTLGTAGQRGPLSPAW